MIAESLQVALSLFLLAVFCLSIYAWTRILTTFRQSGETPLAARERPAAHWTLAEFFVCFGLYIVCSAAGLSVARRAAWFSYDPLEAVNATADAAMPRTADDMVVSILISSVASALAVASVMVWMNLTWRLSIDRYGFWPSREDWRLGTVAAILILPPVLLLSTALNFVIPYEHQVLDAVKQQPTATVFVTMVFSTVVVAPLFEEFMFRGLLQGGAQAVSRRIRHVAHGEPADGPPLLCTAEEISQWPWWPVWMSSLTFAVLHLGQGAAPLPLFALALGLGYVYRQTGRLWPCIIVHAILNGLTMLSLGLGSAAGTPIP